MRAHVVIAPVFLAFAAALGAQSRIEQPQLGLMLDRGGAARPIYGVAGSVTCGDAVATGATGVGCSARACLVKTDSAVVRVMRSANSFIEAPGGPAVLALDGDTAFVYFSELKRLLRWSNGQLAAVDLPVPDVVATAAIVSLRVRKSVLEFAVTQDDGKTWIVRSDGSFVDFVTDGRGPVLLLQHGVLFATADGLVLRRSDGSELRFDVAGVVSLFEVGEGYVEALTASAAYGIKIDSGREQMFLLPEPQL
jgi:hypothetical protein